MGFLKDTALIFIFTLFIVAGVGVFTDVTCSMNSPQKVDIESASMAGQTHGAFSLFGGTIDEQQYYFFYVKEDNGLMLDKSEADATVIVETDDKKPHIVKRHCKDNTIYVPGNTVIKDYSVAQPGLKN